MKFIDNNYKEIYLSDITNDTLYWTYNINEKDFFLKSSKDWYELKSDAYILNIGGAIINIPANFYIIIGDYDGGLDTITPVEIVGREFEAFSFSSNLEVDSWQLEPIHVVGYKESVEFIIPEFKTPIPILTSAKRAILVSEKEVWNKIKHITFSDII